jgi:proline iminopeptidase
MLVRPLVAALAAAAIVPAAARESRIPVAHTSLYARDAGNGTPIIVLHGGPDFDTSYLLPDLDRLTDRYHLIYYDQRGRGKSAAHVQPDDVTLASDLDDLDVVRQHFQLQSATLLGHSWGTVLALEYALRHPSRVSRLILMNPAPASAADLAFFRKAYAERLGPDLERQRALVNTPAYQAGDPDAVIARYRIHFKPALVRAADYERLMSMMKTAFVSQGHAGILEARAVEARLYRDTWNVEGYDLMAKLHDLHVPTLVVTGNRDFIPVEIASHIAAAIPGAQLVTLEDCGHFAFLERPGEVHKAIDRFVEANSRASSDRRTSDGPR